MLGLPPRQEDAGLCHTHIAWPGARPPSASSDRGGPGYSRRSWAFQGTCTKGRLRRPPAPAHRGSAPGLLAKSAWARGGSGQPGVLCANHILIPEPPPQANRDSRRILQARAWTHVPAAARKEPQTETLTGLTQCLVWEGGTVVHFLPNILFKTFQA